jgi:serine/threonine protein kinase
MMICPHCGRQYPDDVRFCAADGQSLVAQQQQSSGGRARASSHVPSADDDLIGRRLFGDYVIRKKLGEGGMGAVYLAEHPGIEQKIAVKVLHGYAAQNDELVQRFNREAKAIARLTHPNIIRVFIFGSTDDGLIYLAMEFVEGRPLRDIMIDIGRLEELRAISIMRQALHALNEAHELGIVHRDLKPDNIMLTKFRGVEEFVKVLDFGIAKVKEPDGSSAKLTQAGVVYGTPEYLSPEQAQAKELDGRSDLYSMGIILYELVTGVVPFQSTTAVAVLASHVYDEPKAPSQVARHSISPKMEQVIMKAIRKDPNQRYQTAMDFLRDLESLEADLIGEAATKTTVLDASQLSLVLEVSRANQLRQKGAPPQPPAPTTPMQRGPGALPPQQAPQVLPPRPVAPPPTAQVPAQPDSRTAILYTVVIGLGVLLLMVIAALVYVILQRGG